MLHLLPTFHSLRDLLAPDVEPTPSAVSSIRHASAPVPYAKQQVLFKAAAAVPVPPAVTHHHWPGAEFITAIGHIHIPLPELRPSYPPHEARYLEAAEMSRLMEHL